MPRTLALLLLLGLAATARADGDHHAVLGIGTQVVREPGWVFRLQQSLDMERSDPDHSTPLFGFRSGLDIYSAGGHWGYSLPVGFYLGGRAGNVRSTIGGGAGLLAIDGRAGDFGFGIAPYVGTTIEIAMGKAIVVVEGRVTREVLGDADDYTLWNVIVMFGRRRER
ncbi:MAG: hypothetical protein H0T89_08270 [Deltaproteobacteria bacterium]|nr:hypothetical protein [Deltaproteobacteria bacterium]MDQ3301538.1 hypothetical protein [Myxococcota bacterium]